MFFQKQMKRVRKKAVYGDKSKRGVYRLFPWISIVLIGVFITITVVSNALTEQSRSDEPAPEAGAESVSLCYISYSPLLFDQRTDTEEEDAASIGVNDNAERSNADKGIVSEHMAAKAENAADYPMPVFASQGFMQGLENADEVKLRRLTVGESEANAVSEPDAEEKEGSDETDTPPADNAEASSELMSEIPEDSSEQETDLSDLQPRPVEGANGNESADNKTGRSTGDGAAEHTTADRNSGSGISALMGPETVNESSLDSYLTGLGGYDRASAHAVYNGIYVETKRIVDSATSSKAGINEGRVMLAGVQDCAFIPPTDELGQPMVFLGWKQLSGAAIFEENTYFTEEEYYSLSQAETGGTVVFQAVWGRQVFVDAVGGDDAWDGLSATAGEPTHFICTADDGAYQRGDLLTAALYQEKSSGLNTESWSSRRAGPVRTMGRAYEILARMETGNPDANLDGYAVKQSESEAGSSYTLETDAGNMAHRYDGQIVLCSDYTYQDETDGRFTYVRWSDVKDTAVAGSDAGESYTTVTIHDGTGEKTAVLGMLNASGKTDFYTADALGYADQDYIRVQKRGDAGISAYGIVKKDAVCLEGGAEFWMKRELNVQSFSTEEGERFTYGRLTQRAQSLRAHTSSALETPQNDGLIRITALRNEIVLTFGDYTRYSIGGPTLFKNLTFRFCHPGTAADAESAAYVGGLMGNGHYLAIETGVTLQQTDPQSDFAYYYLPNLYGGGSGYQSSMHPVRQQDGLNLQSSSERYQLADGSDALRRARLTVKSGRWASVLGGGIGMMLGTAVDDVQSGGRAENNAAVLNVYGGSFVSLSGAGHEGALASNTYVYVYGSGADIAGVYGTGAGFGGALAGGQANVLIRMPKENRISYVYGASNNSDNIGDVNVVVRSGTITELYGGGNTGTVKGNVSVTMSGGEIGQLVGGGKSGNITEKVTICILGGVIEGTVYTSGQGGTEIYDETEFYGTESEQPITDPTDPRLSLLFLGNTESDSPAGQSISMRQAVGNLNAAGFTGRYVNSALYQAVDMNHYYYPHVFNSAAGMPEYACFMTGFRHKTEQQGENTVYSLVRSIVHLRLAEIGEAEVNISGGVIKGDVYGGGAVSVVKGAAAVYITGGTIYGDVYGGGDGTLVPKVDLTYDTDVFAGDDAVTGQESFEWAGTDHFGSITDYSVDGANGNVPVDYEAKKVYSPSFDYMGAVTGGTSVVVSEQAEISGSVYGGGYSGTVFGDAMVSIDGGFVSGQVYGGGHAGNIRYADDTAASGGNTSVRITAGEIAGSVYGGGRISGRIEGAITVAVDGGCMDAVYGGGDQADYDGATAIHISEGTIGRAYGGGNQAAVSAVEIELSGGTVQALFGGGRAGRVGLETPSDVDNSDETDSAISNTEDSGAVLQPEAKLEAKPERKPETKPEAKPNSDGDVISLKVSGGSVLNAVYGGGDEGGLVYGDTLVQIQTPLSCSIYGGGNGESTSSFGSIYMLITESIEQPKADEIEDAAGDSDVLHEEEEAAPGIYAGARKGQVSGNTALYILGADTAHIAEIIEQAGTTPALFKRLKADRSFSEAGTRIQVLGNVYGGGAGKTALVDGKAEIYLFHTEIGSEEHSDSAYEGVYGGGASGTVHAGTEVTIQSSVVHTNIFGGGCGAEATVKGGSSVKIGGAAKEDSEILGAVYGGGAEGMVEGGSNVEIRSGSYAGDVMGGSLQGKTLGGTGLRVFAGVFEKAVYGGSAQGIVDGDTKLEIKGGSFLAPVYGGGHTAEVSGDAILSITGGEFAEPVYGGSLYGHAANTNVRITKGSMEKAVYAGGYMDTISGCTRAELSGGSYAADVFGGSCEGAVMGGTELSLSGGAFFGNVYGGSQTGRVQAETIVNMNGGTLHGDLLGGGLEKAVSEHTVINLYGGELKGNVFGGGADSSVEGTASVYVKAHIKLGGSMFGGSCRSGKVEQSIINVEQPIEPGHTASGEAEKLPAAVYGGGYGEETSVIAASLNIYADVQGAVYGGGLLGCIGDGIRDSETGAVSFVREGNTEVHQYGGTIYGSLYGGGSCADSIVKQNGGMVFGRSSVHLYAGAVKGNVYGGGHLAYTYAPEAAVPAVQIRLDHAQAEAGNQTGITINGSVYGGGRNDTAFRSAATAMVVGDVSISAEGGDVRIDGSVLGDGEACLVDGEKDLRVPALKNDEGQNKAVGKIRSAELLEPAVYAAAGKYHSGDVFNADQMPVVITEKSAFTVRFDIGNLLEGCEAFEPYLSAEVLQNGEKNGHLPRGTKLTLISIVSGEAPAYYHYICKEATKEVPLTAFTKMGGAERYSVTYREEGVGESLVFIVDFEDTAEALTEDDHGAIALIYRSEEMKREIAAAVSETAFAAYTRRSSQNNSSATGVSGFSMTAQSPQSTGGPIRLTISLVEDMHTVDTRYLQRNYSILLTYMVWDPNTEAYVEKAFPADTVFQVNGCNVRWLQKKETAVALPVGASSPEAGITEIRVMPNEELFHEGKVKLCAVLYSAPDRMIYYNNLKVGVPPAEAELVLEYRESNPAEGG